MLANNVKMSVTGTPGTGNVTLNTAVTGFAAFSDVFPVGSYLYYTIIDGNDSEMGYGLLLNSTTLVRTKVLQTQVAGIVTTLAPTAISASAAAVVINAINGNSVRSGNPNMNSGDLILPANIFNATTSTRTMVSGSAQFIPMYIDTPTSIRGLAFSIKTAAGVGTDTIKSVLYSMSEQTKPSKILATCADADPSTTGFKTPGFVGGNLLLPSGWYFAGIVSNVGPVINATFYQYFQSPIPTKINTNFPWQYNSYQLAGIVSFVDDPTLTINNLLNNFPLPQILLEVA